MHLVDAVRERQIEACEFAHVADVRQLASIDMSDMPINCRKHPVDGRHEYFAIATALPATRYAHQRN